LWIKIFQASARQRGLGSLREPGKLPGRGLKNFYPSFEMELVSQVKQRGYRREQRVKLCDYDEHDDDHPGQRGHHGLLVPPRRFEHQVYNGNDYAYGGDLIDYGHFHGGLSLCWGVFEN
jgi:hypothetical protein